MELARAPEQWLEGYTNIDGRVDAWCWYFRVARREWCGMRSSRVCRRGGIGGVQVHWKSECDFWCSRNGKKIATLRCLQVKDEEVCAAHLALYKEVRLRLRSQWDPRRRRQGGRNPLKYESTTTEGITTLVSAQPQFGQCVPRKPGEIRGLRCLNSWQPSRKVLPASLIG